MSGIKTHRATGAALALAGIALCAPMTQAFAAGDASDFSIDRPAGLALLGVALLGIGGAFRWAMSKPAPQAAAVPVDAHEYRNGFRKEVRDMPQPTTRDNVVIELRQVLAARQAKLALQAPAAEPAIFSPAEHLRLQQKLNGRAASLRDRQSNQAKRRFIRSGVDVHGLAAE